MNEARPGMELSPLDALLIRTAAAYGVPIETLQGGSHSREHVNARRYFCWRAHELGFSSVEIGRRLHRHHTSVLHLLGRLGTKARAQDPKGSRSTRAERA